MNKRVRLKQIQPFPAAWADNGSGGKALKNHPKPAPITQVKGISFHLRREKIVTSISQLALLDKPTAIGRR
ncbi:hypothetical protein [Salaquimonas pukyongi]|uniref:hypothetical protein n=1 Tax=Salaquimonas pukyongi TaxID=2712698 RepID=UPI0012EC3C6F|nr:hypothetical protein [Salaquimonas pukyongi]